jgi:hypothetical protein
MKALSFVTSLHLMSCLATNAELWDLGLIKFNDFKHKIQSLMQHGFFFIFILAGHVSAALGHHQV